MARGGMNTVQKKVRPDVWLWMALIILSLVLLGLSEALT
jgi:hypothetical protein